jgi:uncharacterized protein YaiI (UPF0178 family)
MNVAVTIWADADSLPKEVRELIARRAAQPGACIRAVFVANRKIPLPPGANLAAVIVGRAGSTALKASLKAALKAAEAPDKTPVATGDGGQDAAPGLAPAAEPDGVPLAERGKEQAEDADSYILAKAAAGDIVVTRDIPLASRAIGRGLIALNDRGELWTADTVRERLSIRDHAEALRLAGLAPELNRGRLFGPKERGAFANALDKALLRARQGREDAL